MKISPFVLTYEEVLGVWNNIRMSE